MHESYVKGQVYSSDIFGGLLGHTMQTPPVTELLEKLVIPSDGGGGTSSASLRQLTIPLKFVGKRYDSVVNHLLIDEQTVVGFAIPLGLKRHGSRVAGRDPARRIISDMIVTMPAADTVLEVTDTIVVLAAAAGGV